MIKKVLVCFEVCLLLEQSIPNFHQPLPWGFTYGTKKTLIPPEYVRSHVCTTAVKLSVFGGSEY